MSLNEYDLKPQYRLTCYMPLTISESNHFFWLRFRTSANQRHSTLPQKWSNPDIFVEDLSES